MDKPHFEVALAVVARGARWLVARRRTNAHLPGVWEFPGGKCEPGETPERAALRELREECAVEATVERSLDPLDCDYGDRTVRLTPVLCRWVGGEGEALHSDECRWVTARELRELAMPAVNAGIVAAALAWAGGNGPGS
jgi:mutator protein MutT